MQFLINIQTWLDLKLIPCISGQQQLKCLTLGKSRLCRCGAVPPEVTLDRWLKVFNMLCNTTLVALFVGNISSFMIGLDRYFDSYIVLVVNLMNSLSKSVNISSIKV
jgi:hypothetical protein